MAKYTHSLASRLSESSHPPLLLLHPLLYLPGLRLMVTPVSPSFAPCTHAASSISFLLALANHLMLAVPGVDKPVCRQSAETEPEETSRTATHVVIMNIIWARSVVVAERSRSVMIRHCAGLVKVKL